MTNQKVKKGGIAVFALLMVVALCFGIIYAAPKSTANAVSTTYSTKTVVGNVTTWSLEGVTSEVKVGDYLTAGSDDNGLLFGGGRDTVRFKAKYLSVKDGGEVYIPVEAGSNGKIAMTVASASDSRHFTLKNSTDTAKRLYSKASDTLTADGKKGPQKFDFVAADLTTVNANSYLILVAVNGEMKPNSFILTTIASSASVTYDANGGSGDAIVDDNAYDIGAAVTVKENTFTAPSGKVFAGFNTKADGTGDTIGATFDIVADTTLYAQWNAYIDAVVAPSDITKLIRNLTADANSLGLPTSVSASCQDGTTVDLTVVWDTASYVLPTADAVLSFTGTVQAEAPDKYVYKDGFVNTTTITFNANLNLEKITSFAAVPQVNVLVGATTYDLPKTVSAETEKGTITFSVDWAEPNPAIDLTKKGEGTVYGIVDFNGTLYELDTDLTPSVSVKVNVYNYTIEKIEAITDDIKTGLSYSFPETVVVEFDGGKTTELAVVWDNGTPTYDKDVIGSYVFSGTVAGTNLYENTNSLAATLTLSVQSYEIVGVAIIDPQSFIKDSATVSELPSEVEVIYDTDKTAKATINWDTTSLDFSTVAQYTITGTLDLPIGLANTAELTAQVVVNIIDYTKASAARSTYFAGDAISVANGATAQFRGFTLNVAASDKAEITCNDTNALFAGLKLKNASIMFTLTRTAKVSFAIYEASTSVQAVFGPVAVGSEGTWNSVITPENVSVNGVTTITTKTLAAGTYRIYSDGANGSSAIRWIVIDDGGSELFMATDATASDTNPVNVNLPTSLASKLTVGEKDYNFYGYVGLNGTLYAKGAEVAASAEGTPYFPVFANVSQINGAALRLSATARAMKFTAVVDALNGKQFLMKMLDNGALQIDAGIKENGADFNATSYAAKLSGDVMYADAIIDVTDDNRGSTFATALNVKFGSTELADFASVSRIPSAIAHIFVEDATTTYTDVQKGYLETYYVVVKNITAVAAQADVTIDTAAATVELPTTVEVTLDDGAKRSVAVVWDMTTIVYGTADTYVVSGALDLTAATDLTNTDSKTASINVIIAAAAPTIFNITAVAAQADVTIDTAAATVELPTTVEVTLDDGAKRSVAVVWDMTTIVYGTADTYVVSGALDLTAATDLTNTDSKTASINVIIAEAVVEPSV